MKLVVVESPAKAKTIEKYLGKGYRVIASKGHVIDLPQSELGIDIENKFKPKYVTKNKASLDNIKKEFKNADELILAVDPDREGEAIGWHIARALKIIKSNGQKASADKPLSRIVFTEITKDAVNLAVKNPRQIDMNLVNAQQTRRILDRLVGYQLSPLLWKKMMYGLSAGRVQSVALRLVVEKELEREAFKSEEYWNLFSLLDTRKVDVAPEVKLVKKAETDAVEVPEKDPGLRFTLTTFKDKKYRIASETEVNKVIATVKDKAWIIADVNSKAAKRSPNPPLNTSTLQQTAANILGMGASRTMKIAQQLYEHGFITYMRTDSFSLSAQAVTAIRGFIAQEFGKNYIPASPRFYKTKSKVAQEAHEAIRPTDIGKTPQTSGLSGEQLRLYEVIWKRTVACQMADALIENGTIRIKVGDYGFELTGLKLVFPGFLAVKADKVKEVELPELKAGQELYLLGINAEQKFTDPPARYSEATLIKALEANGIGRPSTYAPILTNIVSKKYIEKEGKYLAPTLLGRALSRLLVDHFSTIMDIKFTAGMEDDLDNIANGEVDWLKFLKDFYSGFEKALTKGGKNIKKENYLILGTSEEKCPTCGKVMQIKLGRFSPFLSCVDFPKCKGMLSMASKIEDQIDIENEDFKSKYKTPPQTDDGRAYSLKKSRFGFFWAHPDYPKVKDTQSLELQDGMVATLFGITPVADDGKQMQLRRSRFGYFWAHPDYPQVKQIRKIDNKQLQEKKKELGLL
jgi:DNA topoisomerase I